MADLWKTFGLTALQDDEKRLKEEAAYLTKEGFLAPPELVPKFSTEDPDADEAMNLVADGSRALDAGGLKDALDRFSAAVEKDPMNLQYRIYKAEVLYAMEQHQEAYQLINSCTLMKDVNQLLMLKGRILQAMELYASAEQAFLKAWEVSNSENEKALLMYQEVRAKRTFGKKLDLFPVQVKVDKISFRGLYASFDIEETGIKLLEDTPQVFCQKMDSKLKGHMACDGCGRDLLSAEDFLEYHVNDVPEDIQTQIEAKWPRVQVTPCPHCNEVFYCDQDCQEKSFVSHHRLLCKILNPQIIALLDETEKKLKEHAKKSPNFQGFGSVTDPLMMCRIWARIICSALDVRGSPIEEKDEAMERTKNEFSYVGTGQNGAIAAKCTTLREKLHEIFNNKFIDVHLAVDEKEFEARYFEINCNSQLFQPKSNYEMLLTHLGYEGNFLEASVKSLLKSTPPPPAVFSGLFELHHLLNHSCNPNCAVSSMGEHIKNKPGLKVFNRRPLKSGEELAISYIDESMPRKLRRQILHDAYDFWCLCARCTYEGDDATTCTQCGLEQSENEKKFLHCSRCKAAWYCSSDCQKKAWSRGHKEICRPAPKTGAKGKKAAPSYAKGQLADVWHFIYDDPMAAAVGLAGVSNILGIYRDDVDRDVGDDGENGVENNVNYDAVD